MIYGTAWKADKTYQLVTDAFKAGFRYFDTAAQPRNYREDLTGGALRSILKKGIAKRDDIYIQTKFSNVDEQDVRLDVPFDPNASITEQVRSSILSSLYNLRPDDATPLEDVYLDCMIIHVPYRQLEDNLEAWAVLEECVPHTIRRLGISNISIETLRTLYAAVKVKPVVVQNAFDPQNNYDIAVRRFCAENDVIYQAFWALSANTSLLQDPAVLQLAEAVGVDAAGALYGLIGGLNIRVLNGTCRIDTMKRDLQQLELLRTWSTSPGHCNDWDRYMARFRAIVGDERANQAIPGGD